MEQVGGPNPKKKRILETRLVVVIVCKGEDDASYDRAKIRVAFFSDIFFFFWQTGVTQLRNYPKVLIPLLFLRCDSNIAYDRPRLSIQSFIKISFFG